MTPGVGVGPDGRHIRLPRDASKWTQTILIIGIVALVMAYAALEPDATGSMLSRVFAALSDALSWVRGASPAPR